MFGNGSIISFCVEGDCRIITTTNVGKMTLYYIDGPIC